MTRSAMYFLFSKRKGEIKMRKDVFNFAITKNLDTVGQFDMPKVQAFSPGNLKCEFLILIPCNYALTETNPESKICHFYIDDYQFERYWRDPEKYIEILKQFNAVIGADFSMYSNLPKAQQIYNCWRSKVLMAYWQHQGINVIPNIQWSDESSFEYCFDGIEPGGIVAISSTGCNGKDTRKIFMKGFRAMDKSLHPKKIILVGVLPKELQNDNRVIQIDSFMSERRKSWVEEAENLK